MCSFTIDTSQGLKKRPPRQTWYLFGIVFKVTEEHPRPFYMGLGPL